MVNWGNDAEGTNANVVGLDRNLKGYGVTGVQSDLPAQFNLDGTLTEMDGGNLSVVLAVSGSGFSVGSAFIPGTIGTGAALWDPKGFLNRSILRNYAGASGTSISDRWDGHGLNIGISVPATAILGDSPPVEILDPQGEIIGRGISQVSQSDFTIVSPRSDDVYVYYPGVAADHPDRAMLIEDVFPELRTIDFEESSTPYAVDGHVYMVLSGDDGSFLFGAPDPSLIPEPTGIVLGLLGSLAYLGLARRSG